MKKNLLLASMLALGLGIAQAQTPAPVQGGAPDQASRPSGNTVPGTLNNGNPGAASTSASGAGTATDTAAPQSFRGCLTENSGKWSLASDHGQTLAISGSSDQLSSYNNQQVRIQGTQSSDGTVTVSSIDKVSDSCNNSGQAAAASDQNNSGAAAGETSAAGQSTTATGTTPATTTPPVSNQTPSNTVGSGATSDQAAAPNTPTSTTGQNSAAVSSQSSAASDQNATPSATTSNNDQNAGTGASGANSNAGAGQSATGRNAPNDQASSDSVRHISDMDNAQKTSAPAATEDQNSAAANGNQKLPQTASPLPLLGLMGLGSLVTGLIARRRK